MAFHQFGCFLGWVEDISSGDRNTNSIGIFDQLKIDFMFGIPYRSASCITLQSWPTEIMTFWVGLRTSLCVVLLHTQAIPRIVKILLFTCCLRRFVCLVTREAFFNAHESIVSSNQIAWYRASAREFYP